MSASDAEPEILQKVNGSVGHISLNRPTALNALTTHMVDHLYAILKEYETSPAISAVLIEHAGGKAFCAGGDVKAVVQMGQAGRVEDAMRFFKSEYRLNYKIATFQKPYVALLDGITMGGGAGISVHGSFRIATERSVFAMPECGIGLIPDIGASYFLSMLPKSIGMYLGLTGARLHGVDVLHAGLATHYIPSAVLPLLALRIDALFSQRASGRNGATAGGDGDHTKLCLLLNEFQAQSPLPQGNLAPHMNAVDTLFGEERSSVEEIITACKAADDFGRHAAMLMDKGSPTSLRLTFELLCRGATLPLSECLRMEYRVVHHLVSQHGSDFYSGVQAALITRTGAPVWQPKRLNEVTTTSVLKMFEVLPPHEELQLQDVNASSKL